MLLSVAVLALLASVQGRAVNISNTWVLPEEGFPVFYRYFRDRISWYEADAVCQFHHANLVTVDTTAQYDAVRAYLKELDISSAVWVGLIRSNPDGDFTWTDYRGLSGDGYWSSAPDTSSAPLCAASDPTADYRWEARACGGPTVASFICELPVPQWALGNEGCMVRALPALTILYLPESAAVQLTADCGMAEIKKVQCTGNVKREDLLKELSCTHEEELSSTSSLISTGSNWPVSTDYTLYDQDTTNSVTTEENMITEHKNEEDINIQHVATATSVTDFIYSSHKALTKSSNSEKLYNILQDENVNLEDNNIQSNLIPKISDGNNVLTNDQLEKLEDEKHMKYKMLHEEIARVGNIDNIFTQPTDHFIPPLVMAKAKISDDMTVLSIAEKHAQQLAEKQFNKHILNKSTYNHTIPNTNATFTKSSKESIDKSFITAVKTIYRKDSKKESSKTNSPKKYISEKYYDAKKKIIKNIEPKELRIEKQTETTLATATPNKIIDITTEKIYLNQNISSNRNLKDNLEMDLTVMFKDSAYLSEERSNFSGDVPALETIQNLTILKSTLNPDLVKLDATPKSEVMENITLAHEVIKITLIAGDDPVSTNSTSFEITTKIPVFRDDHQNYTFTLNPLATGKSWDVHNAENVSTATNTTTQIMESVTMTALSTYTSTIESAPENVTLTQTQPKTISTEITSTTERITTTEIQNNINNTEGVPQDTIVPRTTSFPIIELGFNNNTNVNVTSTSNETMVNIDGLNGADYHEILMNMTDNRHSDGENINESDFQSPLLSGAMEPMHRPPRTRRPQPPNRNKFNPFRILG